ncbi:MAG: hypothetical protein JRN21_03810 [Nitrososphaerota archaeon]|nr:hypothetical protein [Nitrososphaerota archaeon]
MTPLDVLRLADVLLLALPMVAVSVLLVLKTRQIRELQKRYNIQMAIFRNLMVVGYLFLAAGFFFLAEDAAEWLGLDYYQGVARMGFHALSLVIVVAVTLSLYQYHRLMAAPPTPGS